MLLSSSQCVSLFFSSMIPISCSSHLWLPVCDFFGLFREEWICCNEYSTKQMKTRLRRCNASWQLSSCHHRLHLILHPLLVLPLQQNRRTFEVLWIRLRAQADSSPPEVNPFINPESFPLARKLATLLHLANCASFHLHPSSFVTLYMAASSVFKSTSHCTFLVLLRFGMHRFQVVPSINGVRITWFSWWYGNRRGKQLASTLPCHILQPVENEQGDES